MEVATRSLEMRPANEGAGRILVVDDEPRVRRLVSRALGSEGIETDQASEGQEGLRKALSASYDVVILDLQLPRLDGLTVLRRLLSAKPGQVVVVSSCQSDPATRSECVRAGARAFLAKPFSLVDLLTSVAVSARGSRVAPPRSAGSAASDRPAGRA